MLYDINSRTLGPYLQLIYSSCTEGIGCRYKDLLALLPELVAELANSCGLACTVYAYYHDYRRRNGKVKSRIVAHYLGDDLVDKPHYLLRVGYTALLDLFAEPVAYLLGGLNSDIAHYHLFLKLVKEILVDNGELVENSLYSTKKELLGLPEAAGYLRKKSHLFPPNQFCY